MVFFSIENEFKTDQFFLSFAPLKVLTMTTLMSSTNAQLPKISYIKSIDVFLGTCFVMVFGSLLEYAVVGYLGKRIAMRKTRHETSAKQHEEHRKKCHAANAAHTVAFGVPEHLQPHSDSGGSHQTAGTVVQQHHPTQTLAQNQPQPPPTQLQHLHHIHSQPIQPQLICATTGLPLDPSIQMTCGLKTPVRRCLSYRFSSVSQMPSHRIKQLISFHLF